MPQASLERQVSLAEIEQRAWRFLHDRGYDARLTARHEHRWAVWECQLVTAQGEALPAGVGAGKGASEPARIGALCEAIEHLLSEVPPAAAALWPASVVAAGLAGDVLAAVLQEQAQAQLACLTYTSFGPGPRQWLEVPLAVSFPSYQDDPYPQDTFPYWTLAPYASNSGTALGASTTEAQLHALNEVIERDALSLLLCRAMFSVGYQPTLIDPQSLPEDLTDQLRHVREVVGATPYLLDLTTDLAVPTMLAYLPPGRGRRVHARGMGTSVSEHHALYRALAELLQLEVLDGVAGPHRLDPLERIDWLLLRGAEFDLSPVLAAAASRPHRPSPDVPPVQDQLRAVCEHVHLAGYRPYYRDIATGTDSLAVVHVMVPGLERIMTLLTGHPALPGPRGLDAARTGATAP